ncbi:putative membrane protein [Mycetocola sp. BIGb0189]|uniref:PH domain-containing protein n=1 Tax=Mycetocola sp. BIGb0189 TaxID=2940604 RepID=UPI002169B3D7|nr:PH domain-containing protein [Mycetocola sp. BIGb0189]MCS4277695.1 putative membrane protein [Mycetocola sp. BIGb0189]
MSGEFAPIPPPTPATASASTPRTVADLTDGEWHRMHPATPLLRGGVAFIVIFGIVVSNFRERLVAFFVPVLNGPEQYDPVTAILNSPNILLILGGVLAVLVLMIVFFYISWRMATFRIGTDAVEIRSGILFRRHRRAQLDRIQSVNISRPLFARIFGAAKLEVSVAGDGANVNLEYLHARDAEPLRAALLTLASGKQHRPAAPASAAHMAGEGAPTTASKLENLVTDRARDLLGPELDLAAHQVTAVVRVSPLRLIVSTVVSLSTVLLIVMVVVVTVMVTRGIYWSLFALLPAILGVVSYYWSRISKSMRYSVASTSAGMRIGAGLLSTTNDTVPPGRVHAVRVTQPLLWRPFGWWKVQINRAGTSVLNAADSATTALPVGRLDDAAAVVGLLLNQPFYQPVRELLNDALNSRNPRGFVGNPRRAAWVDPFAWRRTGYTLTGDLLIFRRGVIWRHLDLIPLARLQSLNTTQGPIERRLRIASVTAHTVLGPVVATLPHMSTRESVDLFERVSAAVALAIGTDTSHRWAQTRASAPVPGAPRIDLGRWEPSSEREAELVAENAQRYPVAGVADNIELGPDLGPQEEK